MDLRYDSPGFEYTLELPLSQFSTGNLSPFTAAALGLSRAAAITAGVMACCTTPSQAPLLGDRGDVNAGSGDPVQSGFGDDRNPADAQTGGDDGDSIMTTVGDAASPALTTRQDYALDANPDVLNPERGMYYWTPRAMPPTPWWLSGSI